MIIYIHVYLNASEYYRSYAIHSFRILFCLTNEKIYPQQLFDFQSTIHVDVYYDRRKSCSIFQLSKPINMNGKSSG